MKRKIEMPEEAVPDLERFMFRGLNHFIQIGTASDRYSGWIGQIYTKDLYVDRITRRSNKVKGKSFTEEVMPVDSVKEYFEHFDVLEVDFAANNLIDLLKG